MRRCSSKQVILGLEREIHCVWCHSCRECTDTSESVMMATAQQVQMWNCKTLEFIRRNKKHLLVNSQIWRLCGSRFQMWRRAGCWYSTLRLRQWHLSANNDQLFNYLSPEEYFGHKVLYSSAPRSKNAQPQTVKMNALRRRQMHVGHVVWRTALITCKDRRLPCFKLARLSFSKEIRCVYKDDPSADGATDFTQWSQRKYNQEFKCFTAALR